MMSETCFKALSMLSYLITMLPDRALEAEETWLGT